MTRKDFTLIAQAIHASKPNNFVKHGYGDDMDDDERRQDIQFSVWRATVNNIADALATTNKQFSRSKFLSACGLTLTVNLDSSAWDLVEQNLTPEQ